MQYKKIAGTALALSAKTRAHLHKNYGHPLNTKRGKIYNNACSTQYKFRCL